MAQNFKQHVRLYDKLPLENIKTSSRKKQWILFKSGLKKDRTGDLKRNKRKLILSHEVALKSEKLNYIPLCDYI